MAWIEMHQSLPTHRKTLALCDELGIEPAQAVGHLCCFWMWAIDNAPHGDVSTVAASVVARAALWPKRNAQAFVDALTAAGFLEDGRIHDWDFYIGKLITRRESNRERMQRARAHDDPPDEPRTTAARAEHVLRTNGARAPATVPNRTQPNQTIENQAPSGAKAPSPPQAGKGRRVTIVDDDFESALEDEFYEAFGSRQAVRDVIAHAMSHKARAKCTDQRAYLRNWVRDDAQKSAQRRGKRQPVVVDQLERPVEIRPPRSCKQCGKACYLNADRCGACRKTDAEKGAA